MQGRGNYCIARLLAIEIEVVAELVNMAVFVQRAKNWLVHQEKDKTGARV